MQQMPCRYVGGSGICGFSKGWEGEECIGADCCYRHELPDLPEILQALAWMHDNGLGPELGA